MTIDPEIAFDHRVTKGNLSWKVHLPNLLEEILTNPTTGALAMPLTILGHTLHELAELAIEIDDPRLHLMMLDLTLYEAGDPNKTDPAEITRIRNLLIDQCEQLNLKLKGTGA